MTEEECARLDELAAAAGRSRAEWVRDILIGQLELRGGEGAGRNGAGGAPGAAGDPAEPAVQGGQGRADDRGAMQSLIAAADAGKTERARKLVASACATEVK